MAVYRFERRIGVGKYGDCAKLNAAVGLRWVGIKALAVGVLRGVGQRQSVCVVSKSVKKIHTQWLNPQEEFPDPCRRL